jgi:hypothetical protein
VRALYFLKPLNSLLRITSRSSYAHPSTTFATFEEYLESQAQPSTSGSASELELRGRIHILMSGLFKISDQSATNSRGAYADMLPGYDEITDGSSKPLEEEMKLTEDAEMEVSENAESGQSNGKHSHTIFICLPNLIFNPASHRIVRRSLRSAALLQQSISYRRTVNTGERLNRIAGIQTRGRNRTIRALKMSRTPVAGLVNTAKSLHASISSEQRRSRVSGAHCFRHSRDV